MKPPHILFIGENWHGSNATSCKRAFRHLGCDVYDLDDYHYFPRWQSSSLRMLRKLIWPLITAEFGREIRKLSQELKPNLVFIFKGTMVRPDTIRACQSTGALVVNFYPDWDFGRFYAQAGNDFVSCMQAYDVLFTPKSYQVDRLKNISARRVEFLPYAFDPWCHYPVGLSAGEVFAYQSDIAFVGTWELERAAILEQLVASDFPHTLAVWGNQWERLDNRSPLRKYVKGRPAYGETQARVFAGSKIALAFIRSPDLHTARSFEIPAFKAFMLAQRSSEHTQFFIEGREFACFSGLDELRERIAFYLAHEAERNSIAEAGYQRVVHGGNSYVDRMQRVLSVYHELNG